MKFNKHIDEEVGASFSTDTIKEIDKAVIEEVVEKSKGPNYVTIANCSRVYLRENPNPDSKPLTVLDCGEKVEMFDEIDGYAWVLTHDELEGYVKMDYIKK